ncbi:unnamed protein product [Leuciscus chuanchicus]
MITEVGCCYLASALSPASHLKEMDLSYNHPGDSGVKMLSERLNDPNCALEKLNVDHNEAFRITPGLQKYFCDLTLDPNTTHTSLLMTENRMVLQDQLRLHQGVEHKWPRSASGPASSPPETVMDQVVPQTY